MSEYNIAVYIRLSMADEDTGKSKAESDSVANQRSLINRFLDCHSELSQCQRSEFCDDGFTGTNMDRPAFAEMMQRVKVGKFNLVCVKDFSRFSRDYIEIGDCLECLFPFLRVRFISINDHYDSADFVGTTGGMDVAMRNIAYAAYSKDLSMKTTSAKIQRMLRGTKRPRPGWMPSRSKRNSVRPRPTSSADLCLPCMSGRLVSRSLTTLSGWRWQRKPQPTTMGGWCSPSRTGWRLRHNETRAHMARWLILSWRVLFLVVVLFRQICYNYIGISRWFIQNLRTCIRNLKRPSGRAFSRLAAFKNLEIHKGFL